MQILIQQFSPGIEILHIYMLLGDPDIAGPKAQLE